MVDKAWKTLDRATDSYIRAGDVVLTDKAVETLREMLGSGQGRHTALRLIGDRAPERPELVRELMPELFAAALGINPFAARARFILAGLHPAARDSLLEPLVSREIANPDPERWDHLRGLAMLLEQIDRMDMLEFLKDAVRDSPEEALRWIAEDFPEHG